MKETAVVWDIDDVLTPTSLCFRNSVLRTHGKCPHPDGWNDYAWGQHIGVDEGKALTDYLTEHQIIETAEPFPFTEQAFSTTKQMGYRNILLSARSWHPDPRGATGIWLSKYALDHYVDSIEFTTVDEPKKDRLETLSERYDIKGFVEDNSTHALAALLIVPNVYLVKKGWNVADRDEPFLNCVSTALEAAQDIVRL